MSDAEADQTQRVTAKAAAPGDPGSGAHHGASGVTGYVWLAWLAVGIPLAWGVWTTLSKAVVLFR